MLRSRRTVATLAAPVVPLPTAAPESLGVDPERLATLARDAEEDGSTCFVVLRRGTVVGEWYWRGATQTTRREVFSVTKSVTSTLVGIAADADLLDIDLPAAEHIPSWRGTDAATVTVRNLLSNDSGREWSATNDYSTLLKAPDPHGLRRRPAAAASAGNGVGLQQRRDPDPGCRPVQRDRSAHLGVRTATALRAARHGARPDDAERGRDQPRLRDAVDLPRPGPVRAAVRPGRLVRGAAGGVLLLGEGRDRCPLAVAERRLRLPVVAQPRRRPAHTARRDQRPRCPRRPEAGAHRAVGTGRPLRGPRVRGAGGAGAPASETVVVRLGDPVDVRGSSGYSIVDAARAVTEALTDR